MKSSSDLGNYVFSELVANLAILVCTNPRWRLPSGIWIPNGRVATGVCGWELRKLELICWSILQGFVKRDAAIRWRNEDKWLQALKHVSWGLRCVSRFCGSQQYDSLATVRLYQIWIGMWLDRSSETIGPRQSNIMVQSPPRWVGVHSRWYSSHQLVSSCVTTLTC